MAGKPITRGSSRVAYAIDKLSKNTLADIILDRIAAEIGEDATDEQVLAHLQPWLDTIQRLRGDRPVDLLGQLERHAHFEAEYLKRDKENRERMAAIDEKQRELVKKIDTHNKAKLSEPYNPH